MDYVGNKQWLSEEWVKPGEAWATSFAIMEPVATAYEYCNLHGLRMEKAWFVRME